MQPSNVRLVGIVFIVLVVAMISFAYHLNGQRPEGPELVVTPPPGTSAPVTPRTLPVTLYAYDARLDTDATGNVLCSEKGLVSVSRSVPETDTPLRSALELLLTTPLTEDERARGLSSEFPLEGVRLESVSVNGKTAVITFADPGNKLSGGSCRISVMRAQIEATAKSFKEVTEVRFMPEGVLEP